MIFVFHIVVETEMLLGFHAILRVINGTYWHVFSVNCNRRISLVSGHGVRNMMFNTGVHTETDGKQQDYSTIKSFLSS